MTAEPQRLSGRVAVVTGGASGIGQATAKLFARHGATVFVGDYRVPSQAESSLRDLGIHTSPCDVRHVGDLQRLIDAATASAGRLDIFVNNAGIGMVKQIGEVTESDWDNCLDTNLKAAFFGAKFAIPHLIAVGGRATNHRCQPVGAGVRSHESTRRNC